MYKEFQLFIHLSLVYTETVYIVYKFSEWE